MKNLYICKHENGHGYCLLNDEYCPQSPCKDEEIITYTPVKHGKWEEMRNAYGKLEGWIHAECGREVKCMEDYCPNCGARMDGE